MARYAFIFYGYIIYTASQIISNAILLSQEKPANLITFEGALTPAVIIIVIVLLEVAHDFYVNWLGSF